MKYELIDNKLLAHSHETFRRRGKNLNPWFGLYNPWFGFYNPWFGLYNPNHGLKFFPFHRYFHIALRSVLYDLIL